MPDEPKILTAEEVAVFRKSLGLHGDTDVLVAKHLKPPDGYAIDANQWRQSLSDDVRQLGCDWLHWFAGEQAENVVGESIRDLCVEHEYAMTLLASRDRELAELRAKVRDSVKAQRDYMEAGLSVVLDDNGNEDKSELEKCERQLDAAQERLLEALAPAQEKP